MLVDLPEGRFVADVGFGGPGATMPLRLASGETQSTPHGAYRIVKDDDMFRLELRLPERWESLYCFSLAPQHHRDFEVGNWFTSTHPASRFRQQLVVARIDGSQRLQLRNRTFGTRFPDGTLKESAVTSAEQLAALLEDRFGIALPAPAAEIWARLPA
jgi:N-hydroxyarylamine O-acetyltransferase